MEYHKITNFLSKNNDELSKFITRKWVLVDKYANNEPYKAGKQMEFNTSMMLKSRFCDYSDGYILVKGTITIAEAGADAAVQRLDKRNKQVTFENFAPFTNCISKINNIQADKTKHLDIVMPMYNLIE